MENTNWQRPSRETAAGDVAKSNCRARYTYWRAIICAELSKNFAKFGYYYQSEIEYKPEWLKISF